MALYLQNLLVARPSQCPPTLVMTLNPVITSRMHPTYILRSPIHSSMSMFVGPTSLDSSDRIDRFVNIYHPSAHLSPLNGPSLSPTLVRSMLTLASPRPYSNQTPWRLARCSSSIVLAHPVWAACVCVWGGGQDWMI